MNKCGSESSATLQFRYSTDLPLPLERASDFLWKPEDMMNWVPCAKSIVYVHNTSNGQFGVGSVRTLRFIGGISLIEVIIRLKPGLCAYQAVSASFGPIPLLRVSWLIDAHEGEIRFSSNTDGSTRLQWSTYFRPYPGRHWLAGLVRLLFAFLVGKLIRNMEQTSKREKLAGPAPSGR